MGIHAHGKESAKAKSNARYKTEGRKSKNRMRHIETINNKRQRRFKNYDESKHLVA